jgi:hypothetical protein
LKKNGRYAKFILSRNLRFHNHALCLVIGITAFFFSHEGDGAVLFNDHLTQKGAYVTLLIYTFFFFFFSLNVIGLNFLVEFGVFIF